jgi:transcriptional regulator with XRE-family HTH domain
MTVNERIKQRRESLNLSVIDIANALNVARTTIYRYESAEIYKMPVGVIEELARVLKTTPEYLMCWTDDPYPYREDSTRKLKDDEIYLIATYIELNSEGKKEAYKQVENLTYIPKFKKATSTREVYPEFEELLAAHSDDPDADLSEDIEIFKQAIEKKKKEKNI